MTASERFWAKVRYGGTTPDTADCWEWIGARTAPGWHGIFAAIATRRSRTMVVAHRYSWELHNGPIPAGLKVCHRCDNPPCVNPDHLYLGTQKVNMSDAGRKGRLGTTRGLCRKGHVIEGANRVVDQSTGRQKCRECMNARRRRTRDIAAAEAIERVLG